MIEINCDLGEGISDEELIYPWIDAASIACGGHYGDEKSILKSMELALKYDVKIGIHPSYPDRENFGRKSLNIPIDELIKSLKIQLDLFLKVAHPLHVKLDHLKFHGALYNDAAKDKNLAEELVSLVHSQLPQIPILVPPFSEMQRAAENSKHPIRLEVFADRTYTDDLKLLDRSQPNSLLTTLPEVENHISPILNQGQLISNSGKKFSIQADTLCIHGDNPGILSFLPKLRQKFWSKLS